MWQKDIMVFWLTECSTNNGIHSQGWFLLCAASCLFSALFLIWLSKILLNIMSASVSLYGNVLSLYLFGSRISTEDLRIVHYKEKDICLCWAPLWCALPLLSATINEIHLRSQARQINPIRFCHSLCVLQWRSLLLFPSSHAFILLLIRILFLLLPSES